MSFIIFMLEICLKKPLTLSPSFFVIIMEVLSKLISALVNKGLITGFMVGPSSGGAINISYLLFEDDTLIFSRAIQIIFAICVCIYALKRFGFED
jgi:hypothetical protein